MVKSRLKEAKLEIKTRNNMDSLRLLPCPFCGKLPECCKDNETTIRRICYGHCGIIAKNEIEADEKWNREVLCQIEAEQKLKDQFLELAKENPSVVIIGLGPNSVKIPLLVFDSLYSCQEYFDKLNLKIENKFIELPDKPSKNILNAIFKNGDYYDGCGECYALEIVPFKFATPMVGWDLD